MKSIPLIDGLSPDEILKMPPDHLKALVFTGEPLVIQVGTAQILGTFRLTDHALIVEIAHIDGGGEGALAALWVLSLRYSHQEALEEVEWIVHAVSCANPNLKLRRVLERRGFLVEEVAGVGLAYHKVHSVDKTFNSTAK